MKVMDVDGDLLARCALASAHAYDQAIVHIDAECKGDIPPLMETLTPKGPYAYTIMPEVHPDGTVRLPILSTRDEIEVAYRLIRGMSDLLYVDGLTEVRGSWYLFQDGLAGGRMKDTGVESVHQTLGLFPCGVGSGITGELIWVRVPPTTVGVGDLSPVWDEEEPERRHHVFRLAEQYRRALEANDVDAVLAVFNDAVASGVRDYVDETGSCTTLEGKDQHREYYEAFFGKFEVMSVHSLARVCEDWYAFNEDRVTVKPRDGSDSRPVAFHTAEFYAVGKDGRFAARIGHGTDIE
jgi:hypothetical protein